MTRCKFEFGTTGRPRLRSRATSYGSRAEVRLPNSAHESRPWRIRAIVSDFTLEDVWALPVDGVADDFRTLIDNTLSSDPAHAQSLPTRVLWRVRDRLGGWFDLGRISATVDNGSDDGAPTLAIPGTNETSLRDRLPDDLRNTVTDLHFVSLPFVPLYRTDVEFAAELSNPTVHGVMHLGWVDEGRGLPERRRYEGRMAVLVKPRGRFGELYMALIRPFRHAIVYPALMRQIERAWNGRARTAPTAATPTDG